MFFLSSSLYYGNNPKNIIVGTAQKGKYLPTPRLSPSSPIRVHVDVRDG